MATETWDSMGPTEYGTGLERLQDDSHLPKQFDDLPAGSWPQMQAYADQMACFANAIDRSGPNSLPHCMMIPEVRNQTPLCLERHKEASIQPCVSPNQASPGSRTSATSFQTPSDSAPMDSAWTSVSSTPKLVSRHSSGSNSNTNLKTKAESQQPKPKKHWSNLQRRRVPHHVVERRYRDNLNGQIEALRVCIPSLATDECSTISDVEDAPVPAKLPSKASVIATAQTYIRVLEDQQARLRTDADALRVQIAGLQKLVRCDDCSVIKYFNSLQLEGAIPAA